MLPVTFADVQSAAAQIHGHARRTPVLTSTTLDAQVGGRIFLKCENLQRIGAFKFRGAYNAISRLTAAERERGVIAFSSGNHAQAVALVSKLLGVRSTIVMPVDAPATKLAATEGYGATVIRYNPAESDREALALQLAQEHGYTVIPPFNHPHIIAGQGTAALELLHEVPDLDLLLVCCGGGGLLSGSVLAAKGINPAIRVVGVEPTLGNDATLSFQTRTLTRIPYPNTIADGTRTTALGPLTFEIILDQVDDMVTVSEEAIKNAVRFAFFRLKLVMEPSGVLGLAALLSGVIQPGLRTGVIISGGNIDAPTMAGILSEVSAG
jgi:threo-3-hydroxy-L-aspartate ammonia-lyase